MKKEKGKQVITIYMNYKFKRCGGLRSRNG